MRNKQNKPVVTIDLEPGEALKLVSETAKFETGKSTSVAEVEKDIATCKKAIKSVLPIEEVAKQVLKNKLDELKKLRRNLLYPKLSIEPFSWRNKQGFPTFALFEIGNKEFMISEDAIPESIPYPVRKSFDDVLLKLKKIHYPKSSLWMRVVFRVICLLGIIFLGVIDGIYHIMADDCSIPWYVHLGVFVLGVLGVNYTDPEKVLTITSHYTGVIPDSVRKKIENVKSDFKSIHILTEVPEWKIEKISNPITDPLVIGFADNSLFLIDSFDTTRIEDYVKDEFAI